MTKMEIVTNRVFLHYRPMPTAVGNLVPEDLRREMRPEAIGERLRLIRVANNLKPTQIADMLNIERTYWSRFEGGKRKISDDAAALVVSRFNVTLDFLILGRWDKLPLDEAEKLRAAAASSEKNN